MFIACLVLPECRIDSHAPEGSSDCIPALTGKSLDIVTWNVHDFPSKGNETINRLSGLILKINPDIIALQEVVSSDAFNRLLAVLPGYHGIINAGSDLNLAYLFKDSISVEYGSEKILFSDDPYDFPRPPLLLTLPEASGDKIILVNIHLKCCDGEENIFRRKSALEKLKQYLDDSLSSARVIVLGDFNDEITKGNPDNVFTAFLDDSLNYRFADRAVAEGDPSTWSFPGWPGDLDHFLITKELFDENYSVSCLTPDRCDSLYFEDISDHRPVLLEMK